MPEKKLTLVGHLDELRGRLIKSVICVVLCFVFLYAFVDSILLFLAKSVESLVFIAPQEAFIARIKVVFFAGLFLSSPFILYQAWRFISDGLNDNEKKYTLFFGPLSFVFFVVGSLFGYMVIVPVGIKFLLGFATESILPMISIQKYVSFVGGLTFIFGIIFELPLALLFLTKIGMVNPDMLVRRRKHAIVIIFISAAMLTPPDAVTQLFMAIPLLALYEIGILFSKMTYKKAG